MCRRMVRTGAAILGLSALGAAGGCASLQSLPLPSVVSGRTYTVTAIFHDALSLPDQASVKHDGAVIGEVTGITTAGYQARVTMRLETGTPLPAGEQAQIRFSSPMGEAFVQLSDPTRSVAGHLHGGDTIPIEATSQSASVTDLLAAVSTVVSGGGFAQMKVIVDELNTALTGHAGDVRELLGRLDSTTSDLNAHTVEFDAALDQLDALSSRLAGDRGLLGQSLTTLAPAIRTLSSQRQELLDLAVQLRRLSAAGTTAIASSRSSMLSVLHDLGPVLDTLTRNQAVFDPIFQGIHDFAAQTDSAMYGNYINFDLFMQLDQTGLASLPGVLGATPSTGGSQPSTAPSVPAIPSLPSLPLPRVGSPAGAGR